MCISFTEISSPKSKATNAFCIRNRKFPNDKWQESRVNVVCLYSSCEHHHSVMLNITNTYTHGHQAHHPRQKNHCNKSCTRVFLSSNYSQKYAPLIKTCNSNVLKHKMRCKEESANPSLHLLKKVRSLVGECSCWNEGSRQMTSSFDYANIWIMMRDLCQNQTRSACWNVVIFINVVCIIFLIAIVENIFCRQDGKLHCKRQGVAHWNKNAKLSQWAIKALLSPNQNVLFKVPLEIFWGLPNLHPDLEMCKSWISIHDTHWLQDLHAVAGPRICPPLMRWLLL